MKILLTDLDGTIRKPKSAEKFINDPDDQEIIKHADEALTHYHNNGWLIIGITNQGGIEAGHKTLEDAKREQQITLKLVPEMSHIYFCPDMRGLHCWKITRDSESLVKQETAEEFGSFRKPGAGMIRLALQYYSPTDCCFVGDREEDSHAALGARIDFIHAAVWRNQYPMFLEIREQRVGENPPTLPDYSQFKPT